MEILNLWYLVTHLYDKCNKWNSFNTSFLLFNSYVVNGVTSFKEKPIENEDIIFTWKFYKRDIF